MNNVRFIDNSIVLADKSQYMDITVDSARVLESWRLSLMSFEWVDFRGNLKVPEEMPEAERKKRQAVEQRIKQNEALPKSILGIGIQDNVEIGSGKAEFLTLAASGLDKIPVHIRKSQIKDFKEFITDID